MKSGGFLNELWRGRALRPLLLIAALLLLATMILPDPRPALPGASEATIVFTPVRLDAGDPVRRDVGRLHFLGGWSLHSSDERLGGLSGLHVENGEAVAVSDVGMLVFFSLPDGPSVPRVRFRPVAQGPGAARSRLTRDAEALQIFGDRLWLSFERYNAVWRYDRAGLGAQAGAQPLAMRRWRGRNSGPEAMVRLADGRFLLIAEGRNDVSPTSEAVLFAEDPAVAGTPAVRLLYRRPPGGYRATDAALLPDGRVLILNRSIAGLRFSARLIVADPRRFRAGGMIEGQEVATLEAPLVVDNMEGLSVTREQGRTIVWLISDDDFMRLFRHTLLLKFELRL